MKKSIFLALAVTWLFTIDVFPWGSEQDYEKLSTHTLITECGYKMLCSNIMLLFKQVDTSLFQATLSEIKEDNNWRSFLSGSIAPDFESKNYDLYQDHFWDPDTNENFTFTNLGNVDPVHYPTHTMSGNLFKNLLAYIGDTAESRFREYFAEAVYLWKINQKARALYYLGMASHYLQDICCPVHSSNTIGILDYEGQHVEFERFVEQIKENYAIESIDRRVDTAERDPLDSFWYQNVISARYMADFLRELCIVCGKTAKGIINGYYASGTQFREPVFNHAAIPSMATAQKAQSILIFAFVYAVNTGTTPTKETTEFTITLYTKEGTFTDSYETDNAIFFGIEFNDGRVFEKYCNRLKYKLKMKQDSYSIQVAGETGQDVRKVWIRKARIMPFASGWIPMIENSWCPRAILLTSSDKGVDFMKEMHETWIKGNKRIVFEVNEQNGYIYDLKDSEKHKGLLPLKREVQSIAL